MNSTVAPTVFEPKAGAGLPFLVFIAIIVVLGGYGVIRSMKSGGPTLWILSAILVVAVGVGVVILKSRSSSGPISIYRDRIASSTWALTFDEIRSVREDHVSATQYSGGRPVVGVQRALVLETTAGPKVIAYEAVYDIDAIRRSLDSALTAYRVR